MTPLKENIRYYMHLKNIKNDSKNNAKNNYKYWQVLPINPVGPGYSPYMSTCSNAIEYRYICLDTLVEEGLLKKLSYMIKSLLPKLGP